MWINGVKKHKAVWAPESMQKRWKTNVSEHVKKNSVCQKNLTDYGSPETLKIIANTTFSAIHRLPFACQEKHETTRAPQNQWKLLKIVGFRRVHIAWAQNGSGRRWGDNSCDSEKLSFP